MSEQLESICDTAHVSKNVDTFRSVLSVIWKFERNSNLGTPIIARRGSAPIASISFIIYAVIGKFIIKMNITNLSETSNAMERDCYVSANVGLDYRTLWTKLGLLATVDGDTNVYERNRWIQYKRGHYSYITSNIRTDFSIAYCNKLNFSSNVH